MWYAQKRRTGHLPISAGKGSTIAGGRILTAYSTSEMQLSKANKVNLSCSRLAMVSQELSNALFFLIAILLLFLMALLDTLSLIEKL